MSFGTPHDIASMHVANKGGLLPGMEQEHVAGPGRPEEPGTWGSHASPHGRDPLGIKDLGKTFTTDKSPLQHNFRGGSPLSTENVDTKAIRKSMAGKIKTKQVLRESLDNKIKDVDSGTMLDENNLLDINLT